MNEINVPLSLCLKRDPDGELMRLKDGHTNRWKYAFDRPTDRPTDRLASDLARDDTKGNYSCNDASSTCMS